MTSGRQDYRGAAAALALTNDLGDTTSLNFAVTGDTSGWPSGASGRNFAAVIDRGTAKEEKVLCASLSTGTMVLSSRGYDGTTAKTHTSGAAVEHFGISADKADDLDAHVYDATRDDHTQYVLLNGTRGFTGVDQLTGTPSSVGGTSNQSGSATTFTRSDHVHAIAQGGISDSGMFAPNVVTSGALAAASVGNGTVLVSGQRFRYIVANAAALPATPTVGDTAFQADIAADLTYQGPTNGWTAAWNMPWGTVGEGTATAAQNGITASVDITGLTVTFTAVAHRKYRISATVPNYLHTSAGSGTDTLIIADGTNTSITSSVQLLGASTTDNIQAVSPVQTPAAGSITWKARFNSSSGANLTFSATSVGVLTVDDVGPAGLPS